MNLSPASFLFCVLNNQEVRPTPLSTIISNANIRMLYSIAQVLAQEAPETTNQVWSFFFPLRLVLQLQIGGKDLSYKCDGQKERKYANLSYGLLIVF